MNINEYQNKLASALEKEQAKAKSEYHKITELAELAGDTNQDIDSITIRDKVLQVIQEDELDRFRGMNHEQLTSLAESFHGQYRAFGQSLNLVCNQ
jgi:esterase/lipase